MIFYGTLVGHGANTSCSKVRWEYFKIELNSQNTDYCSVLITMEGFPMNNTGGSTVHPHTGAPLEGFYHWLTDWLPIIGWLTNQQAPLMTHRPIGSFLCHWVTVRLSLSTRTVPVSTRLVTNMSAKLIVEPSVSDRQQLMKPYSGANNDPGPHLLVGTRCRKKI